MECKKTIEIDSLLQQINLIENEKHDINNVLISKERKYESNLA